MSEEQSAYSFLALILPLEWARGPDSTLDPNPWYAFQGEINSVRSGVKNTKDGKRPWKSHGTDEYRHSP